MMTFHPTKDVMKSGRCNYDYSDVILDSPEMFRAF